MKDFNCTLPCYTHSFVYDMIDQKANLQLQDPHNMVKSEFYSIALLFSKYVWY